MSKKTTILGIMPINTKWLCFLGVLFCLTTPTYADPGDACTISGKIYEVESPSGPSTICNGTTLQILESAKASPVAKGVGTDSPDRTFHVETEDANNSALTSVARLTHTTSGTPSTGIGASIEFEVETSASNNEVGAIIGAVTTDVTSATEDFDLILSTMAGGSSVTEKMRIQSTGEVGIGKTPSSGVALDVLGNIEYSGTLSDVSDRRLKENIKHLPNGQVEKLIKLEGVSFHMKDVPGATTEYGFIAQDVQKVFPSLVLQRSEGMLTMNYIGLIAPMVEAIKEQDAVIKNLREQHADLLLRIEALEAQ